jgi:hypothetical protein
MARVNIEDGALPRIAKLAGLMGVTDREAAGTVYMLWRDSQDVLALYATREDIVDWAHLYGMDDAEVDRWIHALLRSRFLSEQDDGRYRIHGNDVQIEGRVSRLRKGTKGAEATKKKWERLQAGQEQAPSTLVPQQSKPIQTKPIQSKPNQPSAEGNPPPPTELVLDLNFGEFLYDVPTAAIRSWHEAFGSKLVETELPKAKAGWLSQPDYKRASTTKGNYIRHWLQNAEKDAKNAARAGPKAEVDMVSFIRRRDEAQAALEKK